MSSIPLVFESTHDMLRYMVSALGGAKVVGAALRPELKPESAARWLLDCCNADRSERLSPDHLIRLLRIARENGVHDGIGYLATEIGYETPKPRSIEAERDEVRQQISVGLRFLQANMAKLESLGDSDG